MLASHRLITQLTIELSLCILLVYFIMLGKERNYLFHCYHFGNLLGSFFKSRSLKEGRFKSK